MITKTALPNLVEINKASHKSVRRLFDELPQISEVQQQMIRERQSRVFGEPPCTEGDSI